MSFVEIGRVLRLVLQPATIARLNGTQWRVLAAVIMLTGSYSKYVDRTFVAQVADLADLDRGDRTLKRTKKALRHLAHLQLIVYEPARREGRQTIVGLPKVSTSISSGGQA